MEVWFDCAGCSASVLASSPAFGLTNRLLRALVYSCPIHWHCTTYSTKTLISTRRRQSRSVLMLSCSVKGYFLQRGTSTGGCAR
jgi:hypothetical protein